MKKLFLLLICCLLITCKKDEITLPIFHPGPLDTGYCEAFRDGKRWKATAFARHHWGIEGYIGLDFVTYSEFGERREKIALNEISIKEGKHFLRGGILDVYDGFVGSSFGVHESDGDVLGPLYLLKEDFENGYVLITKMDTVSNVVEGMFNEIRFYNSSGHQQYPAEVTFRLGKFSMKIID